MTQRGERWEGDALVLSSVDSNSDRIVRLLTAEDRLVAAIARHGRRTSKRAPSPIQPLALAHVVLSESPTRELARLLRATTEHGFAILRGDLLRFALATTMSEVVLTLMQEFGREAGTFALLSRAWRVLDDPDQRPSEDLLLLFELRALGLSGSLPPPETLDGLSASARDTLSGWLAGRWRPLRPRDRATVARSLEGLIADASGSRGLRSRAFLDQLLTDR